MTRTFYTGARTDLIATLKRKAKRLVRAKLARAAAPYDWLNNPAKIIARLLKIGLIDSTTYKVLAKWIKNQQQSDSCGGQAGGYWIGLAFAILMDILYQEISAKSIYAPIAYPQGGTTDTALQNQIAKIGALLENILPSYRPNGGTDESWMTDKSWMTPPNLILLAQYAGWVEVTVDNNVNAIAEAIFEHYATIWHIQGDFYDTPNWTSDAPMPPKNDVALGGHFMCQFHAAERNGVNTIFSLQSWGANVGDGGVQYFDQRPGGYIGSKYLVDIFTFAPKYVPHPIVPGQLIPNPSVITWQQRLVNYFTALFSGAFKTATSFFNP